MEYNSDQIKKNPFPSPQFFPFQALKLIKSPLELFWLSMTSEIESSKFTVILHCMKTNKNEREKLQWRLLFEASNLNLHCQGPIHHHKQGRWHLWWDWWQKHCPRLSWILLPDTLKTRVSKKYIGIVSKILYLIIFPYISFLCKINSHLFFSPLTSVKLKFNIDYVFLFN